MFLSLVGLQSVLFDVSKCKMIHIFLKYQMSGYIQGDRKMFTHLCEYIYDLISNGLHLFTISVNTVLEYFTYD